MSMALTFAVRSVEPQLEHAGQSLSGVSVVTPSGVSHLVQKRGQVLYRPPSMSSARHGH